MTTRIEEPRNSGLGELTGFIAIGMKRQALRAVRRILSKPRISSNEFHESMRALGMFLSNAEMLKWRGMLEEAYGRQSKRIKRQMDCTMLAYYCALYDWENAGRFISSAQTPSPDGAFLVMDVLLETNRLDEAKKLSGKIERMLSRDNDRFTYALLITALGAYCQRVGEWDKALAVWKNAPLEEAFREHALLGTVQIHLARGLVSVRNGLQAILNPSFIRRLTPIHSAFPATTVKSVAELKESW